MKKDWELYALAALAAFFLWLIFAVSRARDTATLDEVRSLREQVKTLERRTAPVAPTMPWWTKRVPEDRNFYEWMVEESQKEARRW